MARSKLARAIKEDTNFTLTENGALTHKSTLDGVLDFFSLAGAKRNDPTGALELFKQAFAQDEKTAILALFNIADVRGGQGERKIFRECLSYIADTDSEVFTKILPLVAEYTRWDNIFHLIEHKKVGPAVIKLIGSQLEADAISKTPSLLAKWMPSVNAGKESRVLAAKLLHASGLVKKYGSFNAAAKAYRKGLAAIREKINIVETAMSQNRWSDINFSAVPSKASKLYRKAFGKHDAERYNAFITKALKGEVKINAGTLYPYELITKARRSHDDTIEALWRQLPNYVSDPDNVRAIGMADVSGSMESMIAGTTSSAMGASLGMALYMAERLNGIFKNTFITFTDSPTLVEIKGKTLNQKLATMQARVGYSTNIQAAFDLILNTALKNQLEDNDLPTHIFVFSDMEFDSGDVRGKTNFQIIKQKYEASGYTMPTLVFWNLQARNNQSPVKMSQPGVYLVSGLSPSTMKAALNTKAVTPYDMMMEVLNGERYARVREALSN